MRTQFAYWLGLCALLLATPTLAQTQYTICQGDSVQLNAPAADLYEWLPQDGLSDPFSKRPKASPGTTTVYKVRRLNTSTNLVVNGNFEQGNTGFQSEYKDSTWIEYEGYYAITTNPLLNHRFMNPCTDNTTGSGKFMVVNGNQLANRAAWMQTIATTANTDYAFSCWINPGISSGDNQAVLQFSINGELLKEPFQYTYGACGWKQFYATWNSGTATRAILSVVNQSLERRGNDFGMDDLLFQKFTTIADSSTVTVKPADASPLIVVTGSEYPCSGDSAILAAPAGKSGYIWNDGNTTQRRRITASGLFIVKTLGANGCYSLPSDPKLIAIQPLPNAPLTTLAPGFATAICPDDSTLLQASEGYDYRWSNGALTKNLLVRTAGTYTVQTISPEGCYSIPSNGITVTVRPRISTPRVTFSGDSSFCAGGSVNVSSSFAVNNFWSTGATTQVVAFAQPGQYWLFAKSPTGCASQKRYVNIGIGGQSIAPIISAKTSLSICPGQTVVLESNFAAGNVWSTGATTRTISVAAGGSFTVSNTNGCGSATSQPVLVTVVALAAAPTISAPADRALCLGESIALTSSATKDNIWSTGDTSRILTVYTTGDYSVYQRVAQCSTATSTPLSVKFNTPPPVPEIVVFGGVNFCPGRSVVLTSSYLANNRWSTGATGNSITITQTGRYYLQLANTSCLSDTSINVVVQVESAPATPTIQFTSNKACEGQNVTLNTGTIGRIIWSTGDITPSIAVNFVGITPVVVRAMGTNGCLSAASSPVQVRIDAIPPVPTITPAAAQTICQNASVVLASNASVRTAWSRGDTAGSIIVRSAGIFTAKAVTSIGCASASSAGVTVSVETPLAQPSVETVGADSLSSSVVGTRYVWRRDGAVLPVTARKLRPITSGNYTVTAYTAIDCASPESSPLLFTITSLADKEAARHLSASPNPATSYVTLTAFKGLHTVEVLDATGRVLISENATGQTSMVISVKDLPAGVYTLRGQTAEGMVRGRFVKE